MVFVDTSAIIACFARSDPQHPIAKATWERLTGEGRSMEDARVIWLDPADHERALSLLLETNRNQVSLVDCSSFNVMRTNGIRDVFAFDPHFAEQGFALVPAA